MSKKRKRRTNSAALGQGSDREAMYEEAERLVKTFAAYGIEGHVTEVTPRTVITTYEFVPLAGTRMSQIVELVSDLVVALAPQIVRINAPLPGRFAVGIDVVNARDHVQR